MTDIWDEKPESSPPCYWYTPAYSKDEVDAFLEKLRTHYARVEEKADAMLRFRKAAEDLGEYGADLYDKLKAAEDWRKTQFGRQVDPQDIRELGRILGIDKWYCEICGHEFYDPKWLVDSDENETPYCPECESININLKESIQKIKEAHLDE